MKSVAYVATAFPTQAFFLENEVHRLVARGVRVRVFRLRGPGENLQPEHRSLLAITEGVGSPIDLRAWSALLRWLFRRPRVLIPEAARMLWASRGSAYALAGHLGYLPAAARVASLVEREGFERVHGGWAHFPASVAYLAARLTGRRFSMAAHAGSDLYRTRAFLAEKARAADFVAVCVRSNGEMLRSLAGPAARVELLYHGVDLARFDGASRERASEPLLLAVGRLHRVKGFDIALRVLARLREQGVPARLELVGDGPERERLEALAQELGVAAHVGFRGALAQRDLLPLYRSAWLLLAPSRVLASGRRDGIPNVVIEALAMGLPCAATRAAGLEEAVAHDVNGVLVPPDDVEALADAIRPLLADPGRLDRLGEAARAGARAAFDVDRSFERLFDLLMGDRPSTGPAEGART